MSKYYLGALETPKIVRYLIWITAIMTLTTAAAEQVFQQILGRSGPQQLLGLSWYGIHHYFFWQPITYLFTQELASQGIHFFYLLTLMFNMYILWVVGSLVHERIGTNHFAGVYFISGALAGLTTLALGGYGLITGPAAALLALCAVAVLFYPENEILLFFQVEVKAKWLFLGVIGAIILLCVSQWDLRSLVLYLSGILFGYLYGVIVLHRLGPFSVTHSVEKALIRCGDWIHRKLSFDKKIRAGKSKIIDFATGDAPLSDDAFVDAMLDKIAKKGEDALSFQERRRLDAISKKKARDE